MQIELPQAQLSFLRESLRNLAEHMERSLRDVAKRMVERTNYGLLIAIDTSVADVNLDLAAATQGVRITSLTVVSVGGGFQISVGDQVLKRGPLGVLEATGFIPASAGDVYDQEGLARIHIKGSGAGTALLRLRGFRTTGPL
jgi:hypothetical protein